MNLPAAGAYTLDCRSADPDASYTVGDVPEISGLVKVLIHLPLPAIWLFGALPGLLIMTDAARRAFAERREALHRP